MWVTDVVDRNGRKYRYNYTGGSGFAAEDSALKLFAQLGLGAPKSVSTSGYEDATQGYVASERQSHPFRGAL